MAAWSDVERIALTLPEAELAEAHEGSPAVAARGRQFARLRWDDGKNEFVQFWVPDADVVNAFVQDDPATFAGMPGYSRKVVVAKLSGMDEQTFREVLVESSAGDIAEGAPRSAVTGAIAAAKALLRRLTKHGDVHVRLGGRPFAIMPRTARCGHAARRGRGSISEGSGRVGRAGLLHRP